MMGERDYAFHRTPQQVQHQERRRQYNVKSTMDTPLAVVSLSDAILGSTED